MYNIFYLNFFAKPLWRKIESEAYDTYRETNRDIFQEDNYGALRNQCPDTCNPDCHENAFCTPGYCIILL